MPLDKLFFFLQPSVAEGLDSNLRCFTSLVGGVDHCSADLLGRDPWDSGTLGRQGQCLWTQSWS